MRLIEWFKNLDSWKRGFTLIGIGILGILFIADITTGLVVICFALMIVGIVLVFI